MLPKSYQINFDVVVIWSQKIKQKIRLGAYNNLELATSNQKLAAISNLQYI